MKGFRAFLLRGNVVDLAIAVVIGVAFTAVVTALVKDLITPLIAAIGGKPDFSALRANSPLPVRCRPVLPWPAMGSGVRGPRSPSLLSCR